MIFMGLRQRGLSDFVVAWAGKDALTVITRLLEDVRRLIQLRFAFLFNKEFAPLPNNTRWLNTQQTSFLSCSCRGSETVTIFSDISILTGRVLCTNGLQSIFAST